MHTGMREGRPNPQRPTLVPHASKQDAYVHARTHLCRSPWPPQPPRPPRRCLPPGAGSSAGRSCRRCRAWACQRPCAAAAQHSTAQHSTAQHSEGEGEGRQGLPRTDMQRAVQAGPRVGTGPLPCQQSDLGLPPAHSPGPAPPPAWCIIAPPSPAPSSGTPAAEPGPLNVPKSKPLESHPAGSARGGGEGRAQSPAPATPGKQSSAPPTCSALFLRAARFASISLTLGTGT